MADDARSDFFTSEARKFSSCCEILKKSVYRDTEEDKKELSNLLDELIAIEYSLKLADEQTAGTIITQCCYLVPLKHDVLVTKVCHLTANLLSKQQMVISYGLETITEYLIEALKTCQAWTFSDILRALAVVVYENGSKLTKFHASLLGPNGYLLQLVKAKEEDIVRGAMQCVENICIRVPGQPYIDEEYYKKCFEVLMDKLQSPKPANMDPIIHARVLISGLRGIHCILLATKTLDPEAVGPLLATQKVYTLYGLPGISTVVPASLDPTPLSEYDPSSKGKKPTPPEPAEDKGASTAQGEAKQAAKKGKGKRKRGKGKKNEDKEPEDGAAEDKALADGMSHLGLGPSVSGGTPGPSAAQSVPGATAQPFMPWTKQSSSESEFSDTEGGQSSKLRSLHCKVRQCAMGCFHAVIKTVEKKVMFGYWPAFIPDTPGVGGPTLFTAIMKDPSPKARTGALAVLTALCDGPKQFLMAAEEADQYRNAPFTPFSVNLGHMVKEIHRCLLLSLVSETSPLATTQIIKCLATLIPNVPYQRLKPGLLSRVVKQIRPYISHRDPNIRVACLTCMGSMASVQAPMIEVLHILQSPHPPTKFSENSGLPQRFVDPLQPAYETARKVSDSASPADSGYNSNSTSGATGASPGIPTPSLPSGSQTPTMSDQKVYGSGNSDISWLVKLCVRNIAPHVLDKSREGQGHVQPLPVRLESLQTLSILAKNYFPLLRPCLFTVRDAIFHCVNDKDPVLQLHGAKLLEETGAAILQQYQDDSPNKPTLEMMTEFWLPLLNGPLPNALQNVDYHAVKSTVCDCLSNMGPDVFLKMPVDKRILCMTLMLGLCSDEDHHVRASAVRALGVYVLYPCLREDVTFVADAASNIVQALSEQILAVRVKAAWALGNLSDALVINKNDNDTAFIEDFSDLLLRKLFEVSIKASQDNDKVKSNSVRALGNLLRYVPERTVKSSWFGSVVDAAVQALVKNVTTGTMKVRWNACYATGNMLKNSSLPLGKSTWSLAVYTALCSVIRDCKNFKVRINAAMAFCMPGSRASYGETEYYVNIWSSLVTALQSAETVTDFAEYRYKDNLTEQVCSTLVHLSQLVGVSDLALLAESLKDKQDVLVPYYDKYKQLIMGKESAKDKVEALKSARDHITEMSAQGGISSDIREFLQLLMELYSLDTKEPTYDESQIGGSPHPPKSGFIQTYD